MSGDYQQRPEPANTLYAYTGAFVDELRRAGIRHAVVCPGSRSTPLALSLAQQSGVRVWMHVDERSAGFFALGMAKRLQEPVALLCTSGTAAANFYPAVIEAHLTHVPLLVLTADRPHELRENGAPQAIDQNRLYGAHIKWYLEAALPEATNESLRYIRTLADRAVALARAVPSGPVHLNFPLREPLTPEPGPLMPIEQRDANAWDGRPNDAPYTLVSDAPLAGPSADALAELLATLSATPRGLIVVGPQYDTNLVEPLLLLARTLGYPLLADPLSQLRVPQSHAHQATLITSYDAFLRSDAFVEQYAPEIVLRFGAMPTSKPLLLYLKRHAACRQIIIDGNGDWNEPTQLAGEMLHTDPVAFCRDLRVACTFNRREKSGMLMPSLSEWESLWRHTEAQTRQTLSDAMQALPERFEGRIFMELAQLLPEDAILFAGNSMPVRDLDTFFWGGAGAIQVAGNRGANGIDGVVSTALGMSAAAATAHHGERAVLVIGDLSFYHDLNGLLAARLHHLDLTIILVNNDGGGIFSFLPQAGYPEHFEQLFGTPTGLDFSHAVNMYGGRFQRVQTWDAFRHAIQASWQDGGLHVIEVPTERAANVLLHRKLWQKVNRALQESGIVALEGEEG